MYYCKLNSFARLFAANGTSIKTYGQVHCKVYLGLRRNFPRTFVVTYVERPIIGADFIKHFGLEIELKNGRIIQIFFWSFSCNKSFS